MFMSPRCVTSRERALSKPRVRATSRFFRTEPQSRGFSPAVTQADPNHSAVRRRCGPGADKYETGTRRAAWTWTHNDQQLASVHSYFYESQNEGPERHYRSQLARVSVLLARSRGGYLKTWRHQLKDRLCRSRSNCFWQRSELSSCQNDQIIVPLCRCDGMGPQEFWNRFYAAEHIVLSTSSNEEPGITAWLKWTKKAQEDRWCFEIDYKDRLQCIVLWFILEAGLVWTWTSPTSPPQTKIILHLKTSSRTRTAVRISHF